MKWTGQNARGESNRGENKKNSSNLFEESVARRQSRRLPPVGGVEFGKDIANVALYRVEAKGKPESDLFVMCAFSDEMKHFELTWGQFIIRVEGLSRI